MTSRVTRSINDSGETLIEILVAVVIMGIASTGLIGALTTGIVATDSHRRLSDAETVVRSYGELVKSAVLHAPSTTLSTDVAAYSAGDTVNLPVATTAGFTDAVPFTVAIDSVLLQVTAKSASSFTAEALASGSHKSGAILSRYEACPTPTYLTAHVSYTNIADRISPPSISSVSYYARDNTLIATTTGGVAAACRDYWQVGATTCAAMRPQEHRTSCDPAWVRVTVRVNSSDTGSASTTTDVLIRRVP